jgi:hypothetical protein
LLRVEKGSAQRGSMHDTLEEGGDDPVRAHRRSGVRS